MSAEVQLPRNFKDFVQYFAKRANLFFCRLIVVLAWTNCNILLELWPKLFSYVWCWCAWLPALWGSWHRRAGLQWLEGAACSTATSSHTWRLSAAVSILVLNLYTFICVYGSNGYISPSSFFFKNVSELQKGFWVYCCFFFARSVNCASWENNALWKTVLLAYWRKYAKLSSLWKYCFTSYDSYSWYIIPAKIS